MTYVGVRDDDICIVSDRPFAPRDGMKVVEIDGVSADDVLCSYRVLDGELVPRHGPHDPAKMRVALVGNWKQRCGISTYSESLWPEVTKHVRDVRLFVERSAEATGNVHLLGDQQLREDQVVPCWTRGQPTTELVAAIRAYDPHVVWVQHEWGLFPDARHWLSLVSALSSKCRVITTMHSIFPKHLDKIVCESATPEVIVHSEGARSCLASKGFSGRVHVIPHGCDEMNAGRLWNLYKSERTIVQLGFGFRYKGWEVALRTVALLAKRWPDVFFTGIFSESPHARLEHEIYHRELMALVTSLGIENHVAIIRGFQTDTAIDSYLRTNRVALFPYVASPEHEVWGASGAARLAMSRGIPVVTSRINHFLDLPTLKGDSPEELAAAIDTLFLAPSSAAADQVRRQTEYVKEHSWANMAKKHIDLFAR